jgi:hypothetical protein
MYINIQSNAFLSLSRHYLYNNNIKGGPFMDVWDELLESLKSEGFEARPVPSGRAAGLAEEIEGLRRSGLLDDKFYENYLGGFRSDLSGALPGAKSTWPPSDASGT